MDKPPVSRVEWDANLYLNAIYGFFADVDPPQNLAPCSDEILVIERQMIPEKVKGG
jgi:hypothetical protein